MRALCPACGFHHEVVRVLEDGHGDARRDIYQVAPLTECDRTWISDKDLFEASARYGVESLVDDGDDDV